MQGDATMAMLNASARSGNAADGPRAAATACGGGLFARDARRRRREATDDCSTRRDKQKVRRDARIHFPASC